MFDESMKKRMFGESMKKRMLGVEQKEGAPQISQEELMAKLQILEELKEQMMQLMGDGMQSNYDEMQKVTVAADDKQNLLKGLNKAEEVVETAPESDDMYEDEDEEDED